MTRVIAIVPAFLIVYVYGPNTAADLIEKAQVVVNLVVPFTVIPLTKFLCSEHKMGIYVLPPWLQKAVRSDSCGSDATELQTARGTQFREARLIWSSPKMG